MAYQSFEDLDVWKRSMRVSIDITKALQNSKNYAFKDQMLGSALSIPSNIAEGAERQTFKEFIYFLNIAKGSSAELRTQLYIARETEVLSQEFCQTKIEELVELSSMLQGLIKSLKKEPNT